MTPKLFVPIAARHGDNMADAQREHAVVRRPDRPRRARHFQGRPSPRRPPLRFPVQDVYRFDERRILAGRVESGTRPGRRPLVFSPTDKTSTVRRSSAGTPRHATRAAGECVGITLTEQIFVERGAIAAHETHAAVREHRASRPHLLAGQAAAPTGRRYKIKLATAEDECEIESIEGVIDASTLTTCPAGSGERSSAATRSPR